MANPNIRIDIASEFKDRGFKQANKASTALDRQFKRLAGTFATVFSTRAIVQFGKAAVKAFEEDELAANRLTQTLKNLGMAFEDPFVAKFISEMEGATGVLDDELRPAMERLLRTTASFTKSQEMLALAIDISRGSGYSLETVVSDLSRAYVGQTRGLMKYNLGLTQAELKVSSFAELQTLLNKQFGGQSQAFLETYAGKISLLNVAYANMSETIGESLVDAMMMAAGQDGIAGLTSAMEDFSDEMANVIRGVGVLLSVLDKIPGVKTGGIAGAITSPFGVGLKVLGELGKRSDKSLFFPTAGIGQPAIDAKRDQIEKDRIKREKQLAALQKKAAEEAAKRAREAAKRERDAQALRRAGTVFDMENIQIVAALQGRISDDQRLRLTALFALNTKNAEAAEKLSLAVLATNSAALQGLGVMMQAGDTVDDVIQKIIKAQTALVLVNSGITSIPKAKNPFEDWLDVIASILDGIGKINTAITNIPKIDTNKNVIVTDNKVVVDNNNNVVVDNNNNSAYWSDPANNNTLIIPDVTDSTFFEATKSVTDLLTEYFMTSSSYTPLLEMAERDAGNYLLTDVTEDNVAVSVTVNVSGNVTTERDLVNAITDGIYQNQKAGKGVIYRATAI